MHVVEMLDVAKSASVGVMTRVHSNAILYHGNGNGTDLRENYFRSVVHY